MVENAEHLFLVEVSIQIYLTAQVGVGALNLGKVLVFAFGVNNTRRGFVFPNRLNHNVSCNAAEGCAPSTQNGTVHYDLFSALQKSIRGSDPDAAIFYLAKLLEGGDLIGACRRLGVIASEDVGLAYPMAAAITDACINTALRLGMPEAANPLSNCAIMLATAPKSNAAHLAYGAAKAAIEAGKGQAIPPHLRQAELFKGYKYPHDYPGHWVKQQYLPDDLIGTRFYQPGENKTEIAAAEYWKKIKGEDK